ncbi:MAG: hypothetical protein OXC96_06100 [Cyanobacteria bacterium MAG CAR1_bin_15]|nr:hypothetical protein [Cyanobacteria bacterium MAG CAR1_bin_15]
MAFLLALGIGPSLGQYEASPDQSQEVSQGQGQQEADQEESQPQDLSQEPQKQNNSCDHIDKENYPFTYKRCLKSENPQKASESLFGKPIVSISEITVPSFNEENWDGIRWWNDTVARQLTSLLSKMIMQTGEVSVRDETKSKYVLKTEIASYKEVEAKGREGGVSFFFIVGIRGGRTEVQSVITLNAQIIDTATNDLIHEASIIGEAQRDGKGVGGFLNLGIINIGGGGNETDVAPPIEEAMQVTLEKTVDYVKCVLVEKNSCLQDYDVLPLKNLMFRPQDP